jgi:hypothetical protein
MAKKPPNPNTAYGRKRIGEEYYQRVANMTPAERKPHKTDQNNATAILWIVVITGCIIAFAIGGMPMLMKFMKYLTNQ